jgi:hypothetical protein
MDNKEVLRESPLGKRVDSMSGFLKVMLISIVPFGGSKLEQAFQPMNQARMSGFRNIFL